VNWGGGGGTPNPPPPRQFPHLLFCILKDGPIFYCVIIMSDVSHVWYYCLRQSCDVRHWCSCLTALASSSLSRCRHRTSTRQTSAGYATFNNNYYYLLHNIWTIERNCFSILEMKHQPRFELCWTNAIFIDVFRSRFDCESLLFKLTATVTVTGKNKI